MNKIIKNVSKTVVWLGIILVGFPVTIAMIGVLWFVVTGSDLLQLTNAEVSRIFVAFVTGVAILVIAETMYQVLEQRK